MECRDSVSGTTHCSTPDPYRTLPLVDRSYESDPGFTVDQGMSDQGLDDRCLYEELGRSFTEQESSGSLDKESTGPSHQCSGVTGSVQCTQGLSPRCSGSVGVGSDGQHGDSSLHQQDGGYQVQRSVRFDLGPTKLVHGSSDRSDGCTHPRGRECSGRSTVQSHSAIPRMGIDRQGDQEDFPVLVHPRRRPVRNSAKQKVAQVLCDPVLPGSRDGQCIGLELDEQVPLRISSFTFNQAGADEGSEGGSSRDTDCSEVDQEGMVPHSPGSIDRLSPETPSSQDLVTQEEGQLMHHNPTELQLVAWMISGIDWLQQGFHKRLQQQSWQLEQRQRINAISLAGSILPSGVNQRVSIPLLQLSL